MSSDTAATRKERIDMVRLDSAVFPGVLSPAEEMLYFSNIEALCDGKGTKLQTYAMINTEGGLSAYALFNGKVLLQTPYFEGSDAVKQAIRMLFRASMEGMRKMHGAQRREIGMEDMAPGVPEESEGPISPKGTHVTKPTEPKTPPGIGADEASSALSEALESYSELSDNPAPDTAQESSNESKQKSSSITRSFRQPAKAPNTKEINEAPATRAAEKRKSKVVAQNAKPAKAAKTNINLVGKGRSTSTPNIEREGVAREMPARVTRARQANVKKTERVVLSSKAAKNGPPSGRKGPSRVAFSSSSSEGESSGSEEYNAAKQEGGSEDESD